MNRKNLIFFTLLLLIPVIFSACCNCGTKEDSYLKGQIIIIGNEPFTQLALRMEDEKVFAIECDKELEKELRKNQGRPFTVSFKESRVENGIPILVVIKAEPINPNTK